MESPVSQPFENVNCVAVSGGFEFDANIEESKVRTSVLKTFNTLSESCNCLDFEPSLDAGAFESSNLPERFSLIFDTVGDRFEDLRFQNIHIHSL